MFNPFALLFFQAEMALPANISGGGYNGEGGMKVHGPWSIVHCLLRNLLLCGIGCPITKYVRYAQGYGPSTVPVDYY